MNLKVYKQLDLDTVLEMFPVELEHVGCMISGDAL